MRNTDLCTSQANLITSNFQKRKTSVAKNEEAVQGARKREQGLSISAVHFPPPDVAPTAQDGRAIVEVPNDYINPHLHILLYAGVNKYV